MRNIRIKKIITLKSIITGIVVLGGFFVFFNISFAMTVPPPCFYYKLDPCFICAGPGDDAYCYNITKGVKPFCREGTLSNGDNYFNCAPANVLPVEQVVEFKSPTGTANFASLICKITNFISQTILPPVAVLMMLVVGFLFLTSGGAPQRAGTAQKALLFTAAGVALLALAPGIVVLIGDLFGSAVVSSSSSCNTITTGTIVGAILKTVNWFSWFVAVVAVVMGLYSGFLYITARDNPQQVQQAAKVFSYVIIGIAVSILAFSAITITKQLMGL